MSLHVNAQHKISSEEASRLLPFFRTLLTNTEAGYVILDQKPMCFDGFCEKICCTELAEYHKSSVALWGSKEILKRPLFRSGNICIHIDEKNELIFVINRRILLETIRDHLLLFQYVLGPAVTPERLLDKILNSDESFFSILKDDRVLIGIALGYGAQNAIFESRLENIQDAKLSADIPPLTSKTHLCTNSFEKNLLLFFPAHQSDRITQRNKNLQPSFGYSTLAKEAQELEKRIQKSSGVLEHREPTFIFGYLQGNSENLELIHSLENTQLSIQKLLRSPFFLNDIIARFVEEPINVPLPSFYSFQIPTNNINYVAAKFLLSFLEGYNQQDIFWFEKGLLDSKEETLNCEQWLLGFPECIRNVRKAVANIENANIFFAQLKKSQSHVSLLDGLLYYKVLKKTENTTLDQPFQVCLDYDIFDPSGKCLNAESKSIIDLQETIPGFAHGIKGMKIGETREIYIHPSLAYGVHTCLEKGIYLHARVKLISIEEKMGKWPELAPIDLSFYSAQFQQECEENYQKCFKSLGTSRGKFLQSFTGLNLSELVKHFHMLTDSDTLTRQELDLMNRFFWNLYFSEQQAINALK